MTENPYSVQKDCQSDSEASAGFDLAFVVWVLITSFLGGLFAHVIRMWLYHGVNFYEQTSGGRVIPWNELPSLF